MPKRAREKTAIQRTIGAGAIEQEGEPPQMSNSRINHIVNDILSFPDPRVEVRTREFKARYEQFSEQYPALFGMCCSAGPPDCPMAAHVRSMIALMMTHRQDGLRAEDPDGAPHLAVRSALISHCVVPALEAASNAAGPVPAPSSSSGGRGGATRDSGKDAK